MQYFIQNIEGNLEDIGENTDLIILVCGHNGFYSYGMFPYIQTWLSSHNISSFCFNYTFGGVIGSKDFFEDIDGYKKNCMRLRIEDLKNVIDHFRMMNSRRRIILLGHSLGGAVVILLNKLYQRSFNEIDNVILLNTMSSLDFWPAEVLEKWKKNEEIELFNNRTKQMLPLGKEFLHETLLADTDFSILKQIENLQKNFIILHGDCDETIPIKHSEKLFSHIHNGGKNQFVKIKDGTHTLNTKHPFEEPSEQLLFALNSINDWLKS